MEPQGKIIWFHQKKIEVFARKKVNIFNNIKLKNFNSIETLIDSLKFDISFIPLTWPDSLKIVLSERIRHLKSNIERPRISRWLGREIVVVGLSPLCQLFMCKMARKPTPTVQLKLKIRKRPHFFKGNQPTIFVKIKLKL